jgi:hypothetical protein
VASVTLRPICPREGDRVRIEVEAGCAEPFATCLETRRSAGIPTPFCPARSIVAIGDTPPLPLSSLILTQIISHKYCGS